MNVNAGCTTHVCVLSDSVCVLLPTPTDTVAPCDSVQCGPNGYCLAGVCLCINSYWGEYCEINPPSKPHLWFVRMSPRVCVCTCACVCMEWMIVMCESVCLLCVSVCLFVYL